jgi:ubiquinone/menaquinone biosynthesis C-methylase UbiE
MEKYNFGPRNFDNPSLFFLLEDFFDNLTRGYFSCARHYRSCQLTGSENILDFGCGGGVGSRILVQQLNESGRLTCIDLSEYWVKKSRKRLKDFPQVEFQQGDIREIGIQNAPFDVITIHYVLHDILPEIRQEITGRLSKLLKPGGCLLIKEPTKVSHGMPVEEIRSLFKNAGLVESGFREDKSYYSGEYMKL